MLRYWSKTLSNIFQHIAHRVAWRWGFLSPFFAFVRPDMRKYLENIRLLKSDIKVGNPRPYSYPVSITLSLSNQCNLSCPICSINNLRSKAIPRVTNHMSLQDIKAFSELFSRAEGVSFMGLVGESVVNPQFAEIVEWLKADYPVSLSISTNGVGITESVQDTLLRTCFDSVTLSIHAATPDTYKALQGGDLSRALGNLRGLAVKKLKANSIYPKITIAYALNTINISEVPQMLDTIRELDINKLHIYHYRDYGAVKWALDGNPEYANACIDKAYAYADRLRISDKLPPARPYFLESAEPSHGASSCRCELPWRGLQMRSSYSHQNCLYLGCCNVLNLFLFNYREHLDRYGKFDFSKIWHHPLMAYLRKTVNASPGVARNPLCEYCKSPLRNHLKDVDNAKNHQLKMNCLRQFYDGFQASCSSPIEPVHGVTILWEEDKELRALV